MTTEVANMRDLPQHIKNKLHRVGSMVVDDKEYIYIGRPGKWGNPFVITQYLSRDQVIRMHKIWWLDEEQKDLRQQARKQLRDKILVCWCAPDLCHGNTIAAWVDSRAKTG